MHFRRRIMEFMFERKIDNLGRIVLPKDIRKYLSIEKKDILILSVKDNKIIIEKNAQSNE